MTKPSHRTDAHTPDRHRRRPAGPPPRRSTTAHERALSNDGAMMRRAVALSPRISESSGVRHPAAVLGLCLAFVGCAEEEKGLPENPRNAAECRHKASYGGEATALDDGVAVTASVTVNESDLDADLENDLGTYRTRFTIQITTIANAGAAVLAEGEALEVPVFCDGEFTADITSSVEPFDVIGTVEGMVTADSASGNWNVSNEMGTWTGIWGGPPIDLPCSEEQLCPDGFTCEEDVCL